MTEATTTSVTTILGTEADIILPHDVLFCILLCLPVISLLRSKLVCKTWCSLIQSPAFIKQHLDYHHHYNLLIWDDGLLGEPRVAHPLRLFSISGDNYEIPPIKLSLDSPCFRGFHRKVINMVSCNGIICLQILDSMYTHNKLNICLWNPATRKLKALPQSPFPPPSLDRHFRKISFEFGRHISLGFGFDDKANDYKVVRIVIHPDFTRVEVYSLNTDSWRIINAVLPVDIVKSNPKSPYRNGTYCWTGGKNRSPSEYELNLCHDCILSFDFSKEVFGTMALPDAVSVKSDRNPLLGFIKDNIACISKNFATNEYSPRKCWDVVYEIWVLNIHGVKESWDKLYKFSLRGAAAGNVLSQNGTFLFFRDANRLYKYNLVTEEIKNLPGLGCTLGDGTLPVVEYKESIVPIESGVGSALVQTSVVPRTEFEQNP